MLGQIKNISKITGLKTPSYHYMLVRDIFHHCVRMSCRRRDKVKHPAILQIRTNNLDFNLLLKWIGKMNTQYEIETGKDGIDVYFSDVENARKVLSMIKRQYSITVKKSTKYAGLRRGRVRVLFVYSIKDYAQNKL